MGWGDELMGSGMARRAAAVGKRAAFGDGKKIIWHPRAREIYRGNPHVVRHGDEGAPDAMWFEHYSGARAYCRSSGPGRRWTFNPSFRAEPGQIFFDDDELAAAEKVERGIVIIEPSVKATAQNKQWRVSRYQRVADELKARGVRVVQFPGSNTLSGVEIIEAESFRIAAAIMARARLYIGAEGGLHHAAAAAGTPAVVIFGGFISPQVTGYAGHASLFTGTGLGCGSWDSCAHCRKCMDAIGVSDVLDVALLKLGM